MLELAFFEGLTQVEIAERTQIPLGTVKTRTLLAMKKLRAALRDEIVVLHCDRGLSGSLSGSGTLIVD